MADRLIQVPYKKGDITNISADRTQITLAGIASGNISTDAAVHNTETANTSLVAADDVGRAVVISTGDGFTQERWIEAINGNVITLSDPVSSATTNGHFNRTQINSSTGLPFTEGEVLVNEQVAISWNSEDLAAVFTGEVERETPATTQATSKRLFRFGGNNDGIFFRPNAANRIVWFNEPDADIEYDSRFTLIGFTSDTGATTRSLGGVTFGRVATGDVADPNVDGYPVSVVSLLDVSTGFQTEGTIATVDSITLNSLQKGVRRHYGGIETVPGSSFHRYHNDPTGGTNQRANDAIVEFTQFGTQIVGSFGSRISGNNSVLRPSIVVGYDDDSNLGYSNPIRPGFIGDFAVRGADNVLYNSFNRAGSTTVEAISIQDIEDQIVFMDNGNSGPPVGQTQTMTLQNWSLDELDAETYGSSQAALVRGGVFPNAATAARNNIRLTKGINVSALNPDTTLLTEPARLTLVGATGTVTTVNTSTGEFDNTILPVYNWAFGDGNVIAQVITSIREEANRTSFIPYDYNITSRRRRFISNRTSFAGPVGPLDISLTLLEDDLITATNAQIDAYTQADMGTAEGIYNQQSLEKFNTPTQPSVDNTWFTREGSDLFAIEQTPAVRNFDVNLRFATDTDFWNHTVVGLLGPILDLSVPPTGTTASFHLQEDQSLILAGTATTPSVLRGGFTLRGNSEVQFINPMEAADGTLIQTSEPMSGEIQISPGTYIIDGVNGNNLDNVTINRVGNTGEVIIRFLNTSGTPTLGTGVRAEVSINVTVQGPAIGVGRIDVFNSSASGTSIANATGTLLDFSSVQDATNIDVGQSLIVVWSGPSHNDARAEVTLVTGVNEIVLATQAEATPAYNANDFTNVVFDPTTDLEFSEANDTLTVDLEIISGETNPLTGDVSFNAWFLNNVKGTLRYNQLISHQPDALEDAGSSGGRSPIILNGDYHKLRPGANASVSIGFVSNRSPSSTSFLTPRIVTATDAGGNPVTFTFNVNPASSPSDFNLESVIAETRSIINQSLDTNTKIANTENVAGWIASGASSVIPERVTFDRDTDYTNTSFDDTPPN